MDWGLRNKISRPNAFNRCGLKTGFRTRSVNCPERWLGRDRGGAAEVWLAQQAAYDLWQARQAAKASKALSGIKALKLQAA
jgi:hypothetical protein